MPGLTFASASSYGRIDPLAGDSAAAADGKDDCEQPIVSHHRLLSRKLVSLVVPNDTSVAFRLVDTRKSRINAHVLPGHLNP